MYIPKVNFNIKSKNSHHMKKVNMTQLSMKYLCFASAILSLVLILSITIFIANQGFKVFDEISIKDFFISSNWAPEEGKYGSFTFIRGTFVLTFLSIFIGGIMGVAVAIFMTKIAPKPLKNILSYAIDLFVGIPSIVYGYIGLTILVPLITKFFPDSMGFGFLPATMVLSVMILPTVINVSKGAIESVDRSLEEGSYAMGATRWQTIMKIILPTAMPGISSGIVLAMARAIGETMAILMVIGNTPQMTSSLLEPTSVLTTAIALDMGNAPFDTGWSNALFMMSTLLLFISLVLIVMVNAITKRRMK